MDEYEIDFDTGKINYFKDNNLITEFEFISFINTCELVLVPNKPVEKALHVALTKEKFPLILSCYIKRIIDGFIIPNTQSNKCLIKIKGKVVYYLYIQREIEKNFFKSNVNYRTLMFIPEYNK